MMADLGRCECRQLNIDPADETELDKDWWEKYELLFSLACFLHDCAHAPFSHTYEFYYGLPKESVDVEWLSANGVFSDEAKKALAGQFIRTIDKQLLSQYRSTGFWNDFLSPKESAGGMTCAPFKAAEHEILSATMVSIEFGHGIQNVCKELLPGNPLAQSVDDCDLEFMARSIIGMKYKDLNKENSLEQSLKNCFISLLNSDTFDVDGLDYAMRDSYNAGIESGRTDHQRLFSSLTIAPVKVLDKASIESERVDGLWLKDSELNSTIPNEQPEFEMDGIFVLEDTEYRPNGPRRAWFSVDPASEQLPDQGVYSWDTRVSVALIRGMAPAFKLTCRKSTFVRGSFKGEVSGRVFANTELGIDESKISRTEYYMVYASSSLSVFKQALDSRNFEYQWVYTHPKVLYQSNFLLCYMLRLSSRFLCCKLHREETQFGEKLIDFITCKGCVYGNDDDPDFQIHKLLGLSTYYDNSKPESSFESVGYKFYRSSDSDMASLFKMILIENRMLGGNRSEVIERYFGAYFARKHQRPLWKTYYEYRWIFDELDRGTRDQIEKEFIEPERTSQIGYKFPDEEIRKLFENEGIRDPVIVQAQLKLKGIDACNTHILHGKSRVIRFEDIMRGSSEKAVSEKMFYVYGDFDEDRELGVDGLRNLFRRIAERLSELAMRGGSPDQTR